MADKRLAIFVFYDQQGIIDDYVTYYLSKIKEVAEYCIFVSQGTLSANEHKKLIGLADETVMRANEGYDAGAIKQVIVDHGRDFLEDYDNLIITNDSLYGPFYPLSLCFQKMEKYDFWGMTKNPGAGSVPEHLQSFFLVIGNRLMHSMEFYDYWAEMPYYNDFNDVLYNYEFSFTKRFEDLGYSWKEYVELDDFLHVPTKYTLNPYYQLLNEAIRIGKFPFLKRKPFSYSDHFLALDRFSRQSFFKAIKYVDETYDYDMDLIWGNLIRSYPAYDLMYNCNLRFLLEEKDGIPQFKSMIVVINVPSNWMKVLRNQYFGVIKQLELIDGGTDTSWFEFFNSPRRIDFSKYDYVCCINGKDFDLTGKNYVDCESAFYACVDNLIYSVGFVSNVQEKFDENKRLGMLFPPGYSDGKCFMDSSSISHEQDLELESLRDAFFSGVPRNKSREVISLSKSWWIRGSLLNDAFEVLQDLPALKKDLILAQVLIMAVQKKGYYSGILECTKYHEIEANNQRYYLDRIKKSFAGTANFTDFDEFIHFVDQFVAWPKIVKEFSGKYNRVFLYGAGEVARKIMPFVPNLEGILVSESANNPSRVANVDVLQFSELRYSEDIGIIVAVSGRYKGQIEEILNKSSFKDQYMSV